MPEIVPQRISVSTEFMKSVWESVEVTKSTIEKEYSKLSVANDFLIKELRGDLKTCFMSVAENIGKRIDGVNGQLFAYGEEIQSFTNDMSVINAEAETLAGGRQNE